MCAHTLQDIINVSTQDMLWGQQLDQWSLGLGSRSVQKRVCGLGNLGIFFIQAKVAAEMFMRFYKCPRECRHI